MPDIFGMKVRMRTKVPFRSSNAEMLKPKAEQKCTSVFNFDVDCLATNFDTNKSIGKHSIKCTSRDGSKILWDGGADLG
jgi:hypothetical protein